MTREEMVTNIQRSLNSLTRLEIQASENNMAHLYGAMQTLANVRDALSAEDAPEVGVEVVEDE